MMPNKPLIWESITINGAEITSSELTELETEAEPEEYFEGGFSITIFVWIDKMAEAFNKALKYALQFRN